MGKKMLPLEKAKIIVFSFSSIFAFKQAKEQILLRGATFKKC